MLGKLEKNEIRTFLILYTTVLSKWIKDLNVGLKTIKFLEVNIGRTLWQKEYFFLELAPKVKETKAKINSSVQSLSHLRLFATPWTAARQASLSITSSQSLPKLMSIESEMWSNHHILCHPLLLMPSIPPSIRVFSNKTALRIRWPKYWSFSFNISPSNEHPGLISFRMNWLDLLAVQDTLKYTNET